MSVAAAGVDVRSLGLEPGGLVPRGAWDGIHVYENSGALPRAFGVFAAEIVPDDDAQRARLLDPSFPYRTTAILARAPERPLPATPPEAAACVRWAEPAGLAAGAEVELLVDFPADGLLVLLDAHYPGWRAEVDGAPVPVHRANHAFRAVSVPAGTHRVRFAYEPTHWRLGLTLAAGAASVFALLALRARSRS